MADFFSDPNCLAPVGVSVEYRADGSFVMRADQELQAYDRCVGDWLERWARERPEQTWLAERRQGEWYRLSYAQARQQVGALAQALLDLELPGRGPLIVLSENDIDHALLSMAAMHVGVPIATLSVAYSRSKGDCAKLRSIIDCLKPSLVFVNDAQAYARALELSGVSCPVVAARNLDAWPAAVDIEQLYATRETPAVATAFAALEADGAARYLLTSGSTGVPKTVINTHRMLCSNQQAIAQCWRFLEQREIVVLDWLPWSHTFGANHNFNLVLRNGGSLYIDEGRPMPGLIERTLDNLRSVRPTLYFNVPRGYEVLLPYLQQDTELAKALFDRLDMLFYAAAALPPHLWTSLSEVAAGVRQEPLFFATEWGSTETSPVLTSVYFRQQMPNNLGLPVPGTEIKFVASGEKLEMRVRSPAVFSQYLNNPELSAAAFDEEGFYRIGDAGCLQDPTRPERGILFNGRVTEDFKLTTGTWVSVGSLRTRLISELAPYVQDAVITGHDRDQIGALLFPSPALRELVGEPARNLPADQWMSLPAVREVLGQRLLNMAEKFPASSLHIERALLLATPPDVDAGEMTDKGYLNQRLALSLRAEQVERLYAEGDSTVLCLEQVKRERAAA